MIVSGLTSSIGMHFARTIIGNPADFDLLQLYGIIFWSDGIWQKES